MPSTRRTRCSLMHLLYASLVVWALQPSAVRAEALQFDLEGTAVFLSDAPLEKIHGTAADGRGSFILDFERPDEAKGELSFPVASMKTGNEVRDRHLRTADWLYASKYPLITFQVRRLSEVTSEVVKGVRIVKCNAHGVFSLRGVEREMTIPVVLKWKGNKAKAEASFNVALADHKVESATGVIGNRVGQSISVSATLTGRSREYEVAP